MDRRFDLRKSCRFLHARYIPLSNFLSHSPTKPCGLHVLILAINIYRITTITYVFNSAKYVTNIKLLTLSLRRIFNRYSANYRSKRSRLLNFLVERSNKWIYNRILFYKIHSLIIFKIDISYFHSSSGRF